MIAALARPLLRTADDDRRRLTRPSAGLQKVLRAWFGRPSAKLWITPRGPKRLRNSGFWG